MKHRTTTFTLFFGALLLLVACFSGKPKLATIRETPAHARASTAATLEKTTLKLAPGLQLKLWATDTLAPDPIALFVDKKGRVYITRTNRQKNSEFDIRGHRDWMTESISLQTLEERRTFLHKTFAPERSKDNEWLKDLNYDGSHDWRDLAVEKEEVWQLEDRNRDGMAEVATRVVNDFNDEITDIAGGILVRDHDMFIACGPDLWRLTDKNGDGIPESKTSISTGWGVHIGFSGHNMSGVVEGPDGRIYWNIGDIGANITSVDGKNHPNPNSGLIARANPDGSDFEIFATGLRNTHEFAFDELGNLISCDNDGDHPGESERLVHIVEGSDAGWRSNWQYGKYTDPLNNGYNVWMDEKLSVPHWDGQAAYIVPPIMNYHNGPTGMVYNPGTALGSAWKKKFFVVEFVGMPTRSPIWAFGLKEKGASFELDGETEAVTGILPTGIAFGPDGALYVADWVNGWGTKDYGRVWRMDVTKETNDLAAVRTETLRLMQLEYEKQKPDYLYALLSNADMRVRQKAQFELVRRGEVGKPWLIEAIEQKENRLARVHGMWGLGQWARAHGGADAMHLSTCLKDQDPEIVAQAAKMLGDLRHTAAGVDVLPLLKHANYRVRFYAAEALGRMAYQPALQPLLDMLEANNDQDLYIRHAGVLALSRIGNVEAMTKLVGNPSKALRTAAVLVLRRLASPEVARFLTDADEYIVTEAARAINDDLSIPAALPALAGMLKDTRFASEPLVRRAINAALRTGAERDLDLLIAFAARSGAPVALRAEALAALGTWAKPSLMDRVDGRYRGPVERDGRMVQKKVAVRLDVLFAETNSDIVAATAGMVANLGMRGTTMDLVKIFEKTTNNTVKVAVLAALNTLKYDKITEVIKTGMEDPDEKVRTAALGLLDNSNTDAENLPAISAAIFGKGSEREQQQLLAVMAKLDAEKTLPILTQLVEKMETKPLSPKIRLELNEAVVATGSSELKARLDALTPSESGIKEYLDLLYGGDSGAGYGTFFYNGTAQCTRCHAINGDGGKVGPDLSHIASTISREQILEAIVDPSARLAPGFGSISVRLKGGQTVYGVLLSENAEEIVLRTSEAEPMHIPLARIERRDNLPSSMPPFGEELTKREIRDLVEYLAGMK
jgi:quinoprotein glucose dehydrogenase